MGVLRARSTVATGVALAVAALCAGSEDARGGMAQRQIVSDRWTSMIPGTSSGRSYAVDFVNPTAAGGKPPAVSQVQLQLPSGARFDTNAIPQCAATDPQLIVLGADACPAGARLGTMTLVFDTGLPGQLHYLRATVTFLNARSQLIFLSQDDATGSRLVSRAKVTADSMEASLPPLPGTPPDGAADLRERATFRSASGRWGSYLVTPPSCPADHRWVERETYTYRDGVRQSVDIPQPCQPGRPARSPRRRPRRPRPPVHRRHSQPPVRRTPEDGREER